MLVGQRRCALKRLIFYIRARGEVGSRKVGWKGAIHAALLSVAEARRSGAKVNFLAKAQEAGGGSILGDVSVVSSIIAGDGD